MDMESREKIKNEIFSLKKEADDELHKQNYDIAINKYKDSILKIKELGTNKDDITEEEKTSFTNEIMIPANLNISYIYLKKNDWKNVILHSTKVLQANQNNTKAKYRRCISYINLGELNKAKEDLDELKNNLGSNTELKMLEEKYSEKEKQLNENEGKIYKKMFKNLRKINHDIEYDQKSSFGKKIDDISTGIWTVWDKFKNVFCFCCRRKVIKKIIKINYPKFNLFI